MHNGMNPGEIDRWAAFKSNELNSEKKAVLRKRKKKSKPKSKKKSRPKLNNKPKAKPKSAEKPVSDAEEDLESIKAEMRKQAIASGRRKIGEQKKERRTVLIPETDWTPSSKVLYKYRQLALRSEDKGEKITLTLEQVRDVVEKKEICIYCRHDKATGFDRVDNKRGYTKENCVPACKICNSMKNVMTLDEFKSRIERINQAFN